VTVTRDRTSVCAAGGQAEHLPAVPKVSKRQPPRKQSSGNGRGRLLRRNDYLWHVGQPVDGLYRVCSGVLKRCLVLAEGHEQVLGFYARGDIVGYEAINQESATASLMALDTTFVEGIPLSEEPLAERDAGMRAAFAAMQADIGRLTLLLQMERTPTCQRLAAFLWRRSLEDDPRGNGASELRLPMNRRDLAAYLGAAPETLCRAFSRLRRLGIIEITRSRVRIVDAARLRDAAWHQPAVDAPVPATSDSALG
jgi:CRP/FNR family transcriptional regulator, anaerobic regulatory protein